MYIKYVLITVWLSLMVSSAEEVDVLPGYSFHKFSGPVNGDIKEIVGPNKKIDYVAKPEYTYVYGVDDPYTGNSQAHQQTRDGNSVFGEYTVMEPDGRIRVVRYTADDKNGFQVQIHYVKPDSNTHTDETKL